ncbi:MAG: hypothetical protein V1668_05000 [Patescibacteria group bacterium]
MFDLDTTWIKLNYFILTNRQDLKKWWVLTLIAIAIFSLVFVITNIALYIISLPKQDAMINSIAASPLDFSAIRAQKKPQMLSISDTAVLPGSAGKYDLAAKVVNPNKNWAATDVIYIFSLGGQAVGEQTESVMPSAEQYLTAYNIRGPESGSGVTGSLEIKNINWVRVPDPTILPKADFTYQDLKFDTSTLKTGQTVYRATGEITNDSYSGFWKVKLQIVLLNNDSIVGINSIFLEKFQSGEKRSLYSQWDAVAGPVGSISVAPSLNLLDAANFIR